MGGEQTLDLAIGGSIALEIEIVEFQPQLRFTVQAEFVEDILEIGLDRSGGNAHVQGDLLVLVPHAGQKSDILLARRKRQPVVIELEEITIG